MRRIVANNALALKIPRGELLLDILVILNKILRERSTKGSEVERSDVLGGKVSSRKSYDIQYTHTLL